MVSETAATPKSSVSRRGKGQRRRMAAVLHDEDVRPSQEERKRGGETDSERGRTVCDERTTSLYLLCLLLVLGCKTKDIGILRRKKAKPSACIL